MPENNLHWYVVYTLPRWEKKVAGFLLDQGIPHYCPLNKVNKVWSDRKKVVMEPLFKGYVFIQAMDKSKWDIKSIDGIINFVYWNGKPAIVRDTEIDTIKRFLQEFSDVQVVNKQLAPNQQVVVRQGLMMNYKGIILEVNGSRAKVKINSMGIELNALFDKKNLEPLDN